VKLLLLTLHIQRPHASGMEIHRAGVRKESAAGPAAAGGDIAYPIGPAGIIHWVRAAEHHGRKTELIQPVCYGIFTGLR
jgi:hypothetical protein